MDIRSNRPRREVEQILRTIPGAIKGTGPDPYGLGQAYRSALIHSLLTSVYEAFIVKSLGGTDDLGNSWPDIKPETKAYGRKSLRNSLALPGNKRRPTLSPDQDAYWKAIFISELTRQTKQITTRTPQTPKKPSDRRRLGYDTPSSSSQRRRSRLGKVGNLARKIITYFTSTPSVQDTYNDYNAFLASVSVEEAQARHLAAAKAWNMVKKKMGATTLLELLGGANVPILNDTGRLQESYNPGPFRIPFVPLNPDQEVRLDGTTLHVDSQVPYKPPKNSARSPVPDNIDPWIAKAKQDAKTALHRRLSEIL